jgi:hypothetical protein
MNSIKLVVPALAISLLAASAAAEELDVKEPEKAETLAPRKPERERWSWNRPEAGFTPTGDLVWKPPPFKFEAGASVRYIDFAAGNDDNSGDSKEQPWKHHPWDPSATGKSKACRGIQTYVFKRGVVYRGELVASESGAADNPIRLTSDPQWRDPQGPDEAVVSGAERVTGWTKGATNKDIPDADKVWYADLNYLPRNVFESNGGKVERLSLARTPNWKVSDPQDVMSEWWTWEQPEWWTGKNVTKINGHDAHLGIDKKHLTHPADYYVGATVRTEFAIVMGTPFPTAVEAFDDAKKAVVFQGPWWGASEKIVTKNRYYLEDKPQYLDEGGEFWFERKGEGGRLFLRLKDDRDPNQSVVEAARYINLIQDQPAHDSPPRLDIIGQDAVNKLNINGISHVVISGLTFRCTNTHWDLTPPPWMHKDIDNACIRLMGSSNDIRIDHCHFEHAGKAVCIKALNTQVHVDNIVIADNEMSFIDHGAVSVIEANKAEKDSYLGDVKFLRNKLYMVGSRAYRQDWSHAVAIQTPVTSEIAGNVLERMYGAGFFITRGKDLLGPNSLREISLGRTLIHNNRVVDSLLCANDWGGIEVNGAGPAYVYNNISGNANGFWNWAYKPGQPNAGARLGMAYYLDGGGSKTFVFNNVAWGLTDDLKSRECNHCAFYEAGPNVFNWFFNNTAYNFMMGSNWSPAGGRYMSLGNAWLHIGSWVYRHGKVKEDKDPPPAGEFPLFGDAYGKNVFQATSKELAVFESNGAKHDSLESMNKVLAEKKSLCADAGTLCADSPVEDADKHDFRPKAKSALIGHGVKVFTPWALYQEVGAWTFRLNRQDPTTLLDEHWFAASYVTDRIDYTHTKLFNLKAVNISEQDYTANPLEDWTSSALKLNGKDQYLTLTNQEITKPQSYKIIVKGQAKTETVPGDQVASPDIASSNFLIEAYFRTTPGQGASVLLSKQAESGYQLAINKAGGVTLTLLASGAKAELASGAKINDGKWHHLVVETDRHARSASIYTDGVRAATGPIELDEKASLSNSGDLFVGKNQNGRAFSGELGYLRIARGTLADARTSIEELYDWEFDGPSSRDFLGHEKTGDFRDAGAFEHSESQTSMSNGK